MEPIFGIVTLTILILTLTEKAVEKEKVRVKPNTFKSRYVSDPKTAFKRPGR